MAQNPSPSLISIAFDHQIFGWQKYGGISRYFYQLAENLSLRPRCKVAVFAPLYVNRYIHGLKTRRSVCNRPLPAIPHTGRLVRRLNGFLARGPLSRFSPDIVHETYYSSTPTGPKRSKSVVTVYDMIHERFPQYFSPLDPTRREKARAVRRADHVICISESTRRDLIDRVNIAPQKTSVIHLGHQLRAGGAQGPASPPNDRPYLLYVGARRGYKNFSGFIKAFGTSPLLVKDFDILAFGGGPFSMEEADLIRSAGLRPNQVQHREGEDNALSLHYRHATCFVFPSLYEGFGIPPLEAMAHDCPVVCGNQSSLPEVVADAGRTVDTADINAFRAALEDVVGNVAVRDRLIEKGRERMKQFSWDKCADETLAVYERILQ